MGVLIREALLFGLYIRKNFGNSLLAWPISEQIITSSSEATLNSSYSWEYTKTDLTSGFGFLSVCPGFAPSLMDLPMWFRFASVCRGILVGIRITEPKKEIGLKVQLL